MISNLLGTKLHQPSLPSKRVERTNLIHDLNKSLVAGRTLTLISAPAGFGKSTLVSEWLRTVELPTTWLSLDQADDDPGRFFAYLIAALQKVNKNIGSDIEGALQSGQLPPLPIIAANLINDILEGTTRFLLVLDDFQMIQDQAIMEVLETILLKPPEQMHLVLITREDPLLPLSRLRANNQMMELRAGDLRFSEREVDLFLNGIMGLALSEGDIITLVNRTEGWAAGLQLAAIAMYSRSDLSEFISHLSGSHRYILSYLIEEVLSRQTGEIQTFLLQTSILDKLCGDLCDALTGSTNSGVLLEKCLHANLFLIPLDDEGRWYRYHHLFQDLLRNQQSRIPQQDILELHRRASQWYEETGMISESIEHALIAADYTHAVQLLEDHARGMIMQGYLKTVEGWMKSIPSEWQSHNPRANLAFAWMHLLRGSYEKVPPYLTLAQQAIAGVGLENEASKALRVEWLALQANLLNVQGKAEKSIELADQALQWASADDFYVKSLAYAARGGGYRLRGNYAGAVEAFQLAIQNSRASGILFVEMPAVSGLLMMAIQHGHLHFAYEVGYQALERLEREGVAHSPIAGIVHGSLGLPCYEWNQLEKAFGYLSQAVQLSSLSGHSAVAVYSKVLLGRVRQVRGDNEAADRTIQEAVDLLRLGIPAWLKPEVAVHLVRFYLDRDNPKLAESALRQLEIPVATGSVLFNPTEIPDLLTQRDGLRCIISLQLLLYQARKGQLLEELQSGVDFARCLVERALSAKRVVVALQALLLRAQILSIQGNLEASLGNLLQAVAMAEPEGYIRLFLDEGPAMAELLNLVLDYPIERSESQEIFIKKLLVSFPTTANRSSSVEAQPRLTATILEDKLVEPLTGREMEVLRLIAEGLKYQEIAVRLVITLNTVRFYVKEIYSKLNVDNRTRAIEAARKHNLL